MSREKISQQLDADFDEVSATGSSGATLFDQIADFMKEAPGSTSDDADFLGSFHHDLLHASTSGFEVETDNLASVLGGMNLSTDDKSPDKPSAESALKRDQTMDLLTQALRFIDDHEFLQPPTVPRPPQARPAAKISSSSASTAASSSQGGEAHTQHAQQQVHAPSIFHQSQQLQPGSVGAASVDAAGSTEAASRAPLPPRDEAGDVDFADSVTVRAEAVHAQILDANVPEGEEQLLGIGDITVGCSDEASGEGGGESQRSDDSDDAGDDKLGGEVGDVSADGVPLGWLPAEARRGAGQGYEPSRQQGESDLSRATPEQLAMHNDVMRKLAASVLGSEAAAEAYLASAANLKPPAQKSAADDAPSGGQAALETELD